MKRLGQPENEIAAVCAKYHALHEVREYEIDECLRRKHYEKAIALLRESKAMDEDSSGLAARHSEKLIAIYQEQTNLPAMREELFYQVFQCRQDDLKYIQMLKQLTKPEDWEPLREQILVYKTAASVRLRVLKSEGLWRRLLSEIQASGSCAAMDAFEAALKKRHPREIMAFYLGYLEQRMPEVNNRRAYWTLIQYLKKTSAYPDGGRAAAQELAEKWKRAFPRRRSLLDELGKAGF